jgi:DNA-binding transcriptional LysR family regulator
MELRELLVFEAVARHRSVTAAARELGIQKSVASKLLGRLEARLGARLLERSSRRIALNEAGRIALDRARSIVSEVADLATDVRELRDEVRGTVVVAAPPDLGAYLAGTFLPALLTAHPELSVALMLDYGFVDLQDPKFDVAFRIGDVKDDRLVARQSGVLRRCTVASPELARKLGLRHPRDLSAAPVVRFSESSREGEWTFESGSETVTVPIVARLVARSFPALLRAAEAGVGVALVPEITAQRALARRDVVRVLPRWRPPAAPIFLVHRSGHQRIRRVAALLAAARSRGLELDAAPARR